MHDLKCRAVLRPGKQGRRELRKKNERWSRCGAAYHWRLLRCLRLFACERPNFLAVEELVGTPLLLSRYFG